MLITFFSGNWVMDSAMFLFFGVFTFIVLIAIISILSKKRVFLAHRPKISVLVPAYNEEKHLAECLQSIVRTKYPMELLLIDDGSTDSTRSIMDRFAQRHSFITVINGKHEGKSPALNLAMKKAKHEIVVCIDADTVIDKAFLENLVKPFKDETVGATNGLCLAKYHNLLTLFQHVEYYYNNLIRLSFSNLFGNGIWFFGAAAAYRKSILKKIGGFSFDTMTEDMDMSLSIANLDYKVLTVNAKYYTKPPSSIVGLFSQRMRWFFGGFQNIIKHKKVFKKNSFAIRYLLANQIFWSVYSILIIPIVVYQVHYWWPATGGFWYVFRWFSLAGPVMVYYKIPEWGLNFINIFGVTAGALTTVLLFASLKKKLRVLDLIPIFFYFPYTLLLNATFLLAAFRMPFKKKKGFIK